MHYDHKSILNYIFLSCFICLVNISWAQPVAPVVAPDTIYGCQGVSVSALATIPGNPANTDVRWYSSATGSGLLFTGNTYTTSSPTPTTIKVYAESYDNGTAEASYPTYPREVVTFIINPIPLAKNISSPTNQVCAGVTIPITIINPNPNHTYKFYTAASGGSLIVTNDTLFAGPLVNNGAASRDTIFYAATINEFGCVSSTRTSKLLKVLPIPTVNANATKSTVCAGDTVTLFGSGGENYIWDPAITDSVPFPIFATTSYTVEGSNASGCTNSDFITITVNPLPNTIATATPNPICNGDSAQLTASGALSYVWESGAISDGDFVKPVSTTIYSVEGTDGNGCKKTAQVQVTVNQLPVVVATATPNPICAGESVQLTGSGATSYVWENGAISDGDFVSPTSNTSYKVVGTDGNGCMDSTTVLVTVHQLPVATAVGDPTSTICEKQSVLLYGSATGNGPFTFTWNKGVQDNVAFKPAVTTTYTVTVTDANNCTDTDDILVTVNPQPNVIAKASPIMLCAGESTQLTGSGAITYIWENGAINDSAFVTPTTSRTYTLIGTDGVGCKDTAQVSVTVSPKPTVQIFANKDEICAGQTVFLQATGITGGTYNWLAPFGYMGGNHSPTVTTNYIVEGIAPNGCRDTLSKTIIVNALPVVTAVATPSAIICEKQSITLFGTATGNSPFTYTWNNSVQNNVSFTPTATATYTVTATDAKGCKNTDNILITVNPQPNVTATATPNPLCAGQSAQLTGSGADTYLWESGGINDGDFVSPPSTTIYSLIGTDGNGCKDTTQVTLTVVAKPTVQINATALEICVGETVSLQGSGIASGTYNWLAPLGFTGGNTSPLVNTDYTVEGIAPSGCRDTTTVTVKVNPLPTVVANASPATETCFGQSITLFGSGTATSYTWDKSVLDNTPFIATATTTYTVSGEDAKGCINTDNITITVNPLPIVSGNATPNPICVGDSSMLTGSGANSYEWESGAFIDGAFVKPINTTTYTVIGIDGKGCRDTAQVVVSVNPLPTVVATASPNPICDGSSTQLTGSGAITYIWDGGNFADGAFQSPVNDTIYYLEGTDINGCKNTAQVSVIVSTLPDVTATVVPGGFICPGDSAQILGSATGNAPFIYSWSNGASNNDFINPSTTTTLTLSVTDAKGCTNTDDVTINVYPKPNITGVANPATICVGDSARLLASGGVSYSWEGGAINDGDFVKPLVTTTYELIGVDANGCADTTIVTLTVDTIPNVKATVNISTICANETVIPNGQGADSYAWSNSATNGNPVALTDSTYLYVTGTTLAGCSARDSVYVNVKPLPVIVAKSDTSEICTGLSVTLFGEGGVNYTWSPSGVTDGVPIFPTTTTTYTVTGLGVNGCSNTANITIVVNPGPTVIANADKTSICQGENVVLTGSGATTYTWSGGVNDGIPTNPQNTTTYTVTGTDADGCTGSDQITINVSPAPTINISPAQDTIAVCIGDDVLLNASGASITWTPTITNNVAFQPTSSAFYVASGTDGIGCVGKDSIYILVSPIPVVKAMANNNPVCIGDTVRLYGEGAASYTWSHGLADSAKTVVTASSETFTVIGTNPGGCSDTDLITINGIAQPTVVGNATKIAICEGEAIILTGSGASTYQWDNGATDGISISPVVTTDYIVRGTDGNGCFNFDTVKVVVISRPIVIASATRTDICLGDSITFKGSGATSYSWDKGIIDGSTYSITTSDTYTVTGTTDGCSSQASVTINVFPKPTVIANASATTICEGQTVVLAGSGLGVGATYTWDSGVSDGFAFIPTVTRNYRLIGETTIGCRDTALIQITLLPAPNVVALASKTSLCKGDSVILMGSGAVSYTWTNGVQNNKAFTPTITANYSVTGTDANGCTSDALIGVVVNNLPNVVANASVTNVCDADSVTLTGSGATSYVWDNSVIDGQPFVLAKDTIFRVLGTDANGCVNKDSINLNVIAKPIVEANASATTVCENDEVIFTGSGTANSYIWKDGIPNGIPYPITESKNYTVYGVDDATGCSDSASVFITVNPAPSTVISYIQGQQEICLGDTVLINVSGGVSVVWDDGSTNRTIARYPTDTSKYYVTATSAIGCLRTDSIQINVKPLPNVKAFIKDNRDTICKGESTFLYATGNSPRVWTPFITENQLFTPFSTQNYIVETTENGCSASDTLEIAVRTVPVFDIVTYTFVPCSNDSFFFDAEPKDKGLSYTWTDASGTSFANGTKQVITSDGVYILKATTPEGCTEEKTVTIATNPLPTVTAGLSKVEICLGDSAQLQAGSVVMPISPPNTLGWMDENGNSFNNGDFVSPTMDTYYIVFYSQSGCTGSDTVLLTVNPLPQVTAGVSDPIICIGDSAKLIATGTATAYDWENGTISNGAFVTPLVTTTYTVRGVSADLCENYDTVTLTVEQKILPDEPLLNCPVHSNSNTSIFSWANVANATAYEVSYDGGITWETPNGATQHTVVETNKLVDNVTLTFRSVRTTSDCGTFYSLLTTTKTCPVVRFVDKDPTIYNSFSPNGDGSNDYWYITEGLENYPDNIVEVYNRWGVKVFETIGYDNNKNVFTGEGLEDGAYFYVVRIPSANVNKTGYVMMIR